MFYDNHIGKSKFILFESIKNGIVTGHTDNYIKVNIKGDFSKVNSIQKVNIFDREKDYMLGEIYQ